MRPPIGDQGIDPRRLAGRRACGRAPPSDYARRLACPGNLVIHVQGFNDLFRDYLNQAQSGVVHDARGDLAHRQAVVAGCVAGWKDGLEECCHDHAQVIIRPDSTGGLARDLHDLGNAGQVIGRLGNGN